jgi:hypothetical protein
MSLTYTWSVTMILSNHNERREIRLKLSLPMVAEWQTKDGLLVRVSAFSDNISKWGLGLILPAHINWIRSGLVINSRINISANQLVTMGTVRHIITQSDGKWLLGLKLDSPLFSWLSRYQGCSKNVLTDLLPTP